MSLEKKAMLTLVISILLSTLASASNYHMTLLTVGEIGDSLIGGTADAYLEIKPGSGRIFLDSFPLTKIDTQISTRYANKIACDYLDIDCGQYDFFYTIRADSTIVGGPSASAPLTILTIAALTKKELKNDTVMTGTINSGGSIGPVGGVLSKAKAAQDAGYKKILIPEFSIDETAEINNTKNPMITTIKVTTSNNITNSTSSKINISNKTKQAKQENNLTISLVKVKSLDDALPYFITLDKENQTQEIELPKEYSQTMMLISEDLCSKAMELKKKVTLNLSDENATLDYEKKINSSNNDKNYYSSASYCFNMGVFLRKINLRQVEDTNPTKIEEIRKKTLDAVNQMDTQLEKINITTLPELESYIIVKERVIESRKILEDYDQNSTTNELAYALERYYSAVYWSRFFTISGKQIYLDQNYLEEACYKKISEAEERINYANLYLPRELQASRQDIDEAYTYAKNGNYKMCLFKASFAKAEANLLLSSLSVTTNQISELALAKIASAKKLIAKEENRGYFPIMGYSYYEYAKSLNSNEDEISSLIFSEYSLELSNLEMYFPKKRATTKFNLSTDQVVLLSSIFFLGVSIGAIAMLYYLKANARKITKEKKGKKRL